MKMMKEPGAYLGGYTLYVFRGRKPERGGGNVTDQPALARAEQSGRTLIGYQRKATRKG